MKPIDRNDYFHSKSSYTKHLKVSLEYSQVINGICSINNDLFNQINKLKLDFTVFYQTQIYSAIIVPRNEALTLPLPQIILHSFGNNIQ